MKSLEIESWALRILERVENRVPIEDLAVELKAEWPDPVKTARKLAGHANAARSETILWIIGVDEQKGVVGADNQELANWFPAIQSRFEGIAPTLQNLNVSYKGKTVAALCFDTSRTPFVVKNPAFGNTTGESVQYEVPWREGAKTRTATRSDLILMLSPLMRIPKIEILSGEVRFFPPSHGPAVGIDFTLILYVVPLDSTPITFPFHKCTAIIFSRGQTVVDDFALVIDTPKGKADKHEANKIPSLHHASNTFNLPVANVNVRTGNEIIECTASEAIFRGAGKVEIDGSSDVSFSDGNQEIELIISLVEAITETKVTLSANFDMGAMRGGTLVWPLATPPKVSKK